MASGPFGRRRGGVAERVREAPPDAPTAAGVAQTVAGVLPEQVLEILPGRVAAALGRRPRGGPLPFLLGLVAGALAGAALGLVAGPDLAGAAAGRDPDRLRGLPERARARVRDAAKRARRSFEQARAATVTAAQTVRRRATGAATEAAESGVPPARAVTTASPAQPPARSLGAALRRRWQEAFAEAKLAAREAEAELRRRYLEQTGRA
jgi:hypothetical protein